MAGHGNLVSRSPHIRKLGDPASASVTCILHTQPSYKVLSVSQFEVTQVGQEICSDTQHPLKVTLASCTCSTISFMLPHSWEHPSDGKHLQFFPSSHSHHSKLQLNTLPTPCTSSSFQELLCIPSYTSPTPSSPCIPFPMNLLDAHKPHLIAPPTPPYPGLCEHHLQACHGGKGPMRQTNKTPVL